MSFSRACVADLKLLTQLAAEKFGSILRTILEIKPASSNLPNSTNAQASHKRGVYDSGLSSTARSRTGIAASLFPFKCKPAPNKPKYQAGGYGQSRTTFYTARILDFLASTTFCRIRGRINLCASCYPSLTIGRYRLRSGLQWRIRGARKWFWCCTSRVSGAPAIRR